MQGPLCTTPWFAGVNSTAVVIKNTVPVNNFHLDCIAVLAPVFFANLRHAYTKMIDHSLLISFV